MELKSYIKGTNIKKFCCEYWKSVSKDLINSQFEVINKADIPDSLKVTIQETINVWSNYCPSCGLSLSSPDTSQGVNTKRSLAQYTHSSTCRQCNGTGKAGRSKDSKAKCTFCLGTGEITPKKNSVDALLKIEELKNKIRKENKPIDPESLNPDLIK